MRSEAEELSARYAQAGEPELLELAQSYDSLTEVAQAALRAEFSRRGMQPPIVDDSYIRAESRTLVTLRRYRDLSEAIVARSMLESAGITAYLRDENLVRLEWQISNLLGGIRLQVAVEDEVTASGLLQQAIFDPIQIGEEEYPQPRCPACKSTNITFQGSSRGVVFASPQPVGPESWRCDSCGARWNEVEDEIGPADK